MGRVFPLRNTIQEYAWGALTFIQDLLSLPPESRETPMAELWMGAHPSAPSHALVHGAWVPLDRLIEEDPEGILGPAVAAAFDGRLPFLFKVLAAGRPLSIQVHPDEIRAREGFERESLAGLDPNHPNRCYRDPFPKPELLCALTPLHALKGVRPVEEMIEMLRRVVPRSLSEEIRTLEARPDEAGVRQLWTGLLGLDSERRSRITQEALASTLDARPGTALAWIGRLAGHYPGDMGLLSPAVLNHLILSPGEAFFVRPGEIHAYLGGAGLELMGNSDNVIRGGLTPKHVDTDELMRVADFSPSKAVLSDAEDLSAAELVYPAPAGEFLLSRITVGPGLDWVGEERAGVEIVLCLKGRADVYDDVLGETVTLPKGQAVLVPASVEKYRIQGEASLARTTVPASAGRGKAG